MKSDHKLESSFRDPSGFLFRREGVLYRQVNQRYRKHYQQLMDSGLYRSLVEAGLMIPHTEVNVEPARPALAFKTIRPKPLPFISYPYEWSFSQLKDTALATLTIQKHALEHGMSLKDSSAYNIQFHDGKPILIDTLSFEAYPEGEPWVAYRQFCQHFLAPLALMAHRDVRLKQLLRVYIDGVPLDLASTLLPFKTRFSFSLLTHIHLHAATQRRYAGKTVDKTTETRRMSKTSFLGLIDSLESGVRNLKWKPIGTEWADYTRSHNYSSEAIEHKKRLVSDFLARIQPETVWDLGANTGEFSRLSGGIPTLAFDIDPGAVEQNYLRCVAQKETNLLPLVLDLTNPSPGIGWQNRERMSLLERGPAGAVLALALIHHLAISNNVPLSRLAAFFAKLSPWLIIEFVPKSDSQVQRLLATRDDIFPDYTLEGFEQAFSQVYTIRASEKIAESERTLYLMKQKEE
ncbi:MAG: SAM-dependent methyltransferase [Anaerolineales bacterium]